MLHSKYNKTDQWGYKDITIKFISVLLEMLLVSIFIWTVLWNKDIDLIHAILENTGVCIGIAIFLIIWNKRGDENNVNDILGFGFLVVSIFDFMHTYYYKGLIINDVFKSELSMGFSLLARLIEVTILMIFSFAPYIKNINRNIMIIGTSIITSSFFYMLYVYPNWIPRLYDAYGITSIKVALEYLVIIISVLVLLKLNSNIQREHFIKFKYLYICLLLIIPSEACLAFYKDLSSFWVVFGHVLKIASYFYLYKAVFQSLINYPYDKIGENNQRLSDILNAIPIAIHTYNSDNKIDFVNRKFEELFKYPKETMIGLNHREALTVLHKIGDEHKNLLAIIVKNNEENTKNIIRSYLNSEGKEIKALINSNKINGGILVLASDVKQEQEIKNLNLQAQAILNAVITPTMILDDGGKIVACNNLYAELIEMEYSDIIDMDIYKLYDILNFSGKGNMDAFKNRDFKNEVIDWLIQTPKGKKKQLQITTSVIANIYNENIGIIFVARDISNMKEEQLKLINQEKLALLGQMGATIVHETRNFLTTIKGNSQLIELYVDDEKIKKYARKINANTNEVNRIISDFLSLSKPRETELEEVAFNDLVFSMKNTIETSSLMKKVELILDLDYDERYILCDETQIRQVILNICKNAVEAMGGILSPILNISTGLDEYKKEVFINISDNGSGIDDETIKKIGTPFFTTKKTGTGLGLNVCYQIIKEHKGRIDVQSELGEGTTFTIVIPYIDEDLDEIVQ
jgi:PAS domain S-box-containing protein